MELWQSPLVVTPLFLGLLLAVGNLVSRRVPIPASIVAGALGLLLGPAVLAVIPFDLPMLELGVYHALGLVFICLGLKRPSTGPQGEAASMGVAIGVMVALQTVIGLALALALGVHVGFGLMLPMGFEQGPGQALSLGKAWEASGMVDGGDVGILMAAIGFLWSVVAGVPLVAYGRAKGWTTPLNVRTGVAPSSDSSSLTVTLSALAITYAATWIVCSGLATALASVPDVAAMVWGFHFLFGSLLATAGRMVLAATDHDHLLDSVQLSQISTSIVDFATVAALTAIQLTVLQANWVPIVVISTIGGISTLAACLLLSWRGFRSAPFEHAVLWFGMSTGTLPVGLALLRTLDPELRGPAPASAVFGTAFAVVGVAPIMLVLHPLAITGQAPLALFLCTLWLGVLLAVWAWITRPSATPTAAESAPDGPG
jgi:ESS family glutamate:Na+ symporter